MRGGRFALMGVLVALIAGSATPGRAAGPSSLTQEQAALYLGCLGAISATTITNGQPSASTSLVSGYKSLSQLTSLNVIQFSVLEGRALDSYGCCLCVHNHARHWAGDAAKQFSGLGTASTFTPSTCLSTALGFTFGSGSTPSCTCDTSTSTATCP
jgi:hypothetical protein